MKIFSLPWYNCFIISNKIQCVYIHRTVTSQASSVFHGWDEELMSSIGVLQAPRYRLRWSHFAMATLQNPQLPYLACYEILPSKAFCSAYWRTHGAEHFTQLLRFASRTSTDERGESDHDRLEYWFLKQVKSITIHSYYRSIWVSVISTNQSPSLQEGLISFYVWLLNLNAASGNYGKRNENEIEPLQKYRGRTFHEMNTIVSSSLCS